MTPPEIPTLGVPDRIPYRDVPFIVIAGLPLILVCAAVVGTVLEDLGIPLEDDNPIVDALIVGSIGVGPAIAYYLQRRLRANGVSHAVGCGSLGAWAVLLGVGAFVAGYLGAALGAVAGVALVRRLPRSRSGEPEPPSDLH